MSEFFTFLLIGLGAGTAYAAISLGLVVTYKGTGVINFAAGAMGAWGGYTFDELRTQGNLWLPIPINFRSRLGGNHYGGFPLWAFTVVSAVFLLGLVVVIFVKPFRSRHPRFSKVMLVLAVPAAVVWAVVVFGKLHGNGHYYLPVIPYKYGVAHSMAVVPAFVIALVLSGILGLLVHFAVFRPLRSAPPLAKVVASVGVMSTIQAMIVFRFGSVARAEAPLLPNGTVKLGDGVAVPGDRLYVAVAAIVVAVALAAFFRYTRVGLAIRGASESERSAVLGGWSPQFLAGLTWVLASVTMSGLVILTLPIIPLTATSYTLLIVPALACALIGRLNNIGVTAAAALGLGALQSLIGFYSTETWWPSWAATGIPNALPFLILIVVLFFLGKSLPVRSSLPSSPLPRVIAPRNRPQVIIPLVAAAVVLLFITSGGWRFSLITSMILSLSALSIVMLTGLTGQISLAQASLAGVAGFSVAKLSNNGVGFPFTLLIAAAIAAAVGVLVGVPALRIRGAQLAVVTLAIGVALDGVLFTNPSFSPPGGAPVPGLEFLGLDLGVRRGSNTARWQFGLVVLIILVIVALLCANIMRSGTGRRFIAIRNNERAGAAVGISIEGSKLLSFGLAAAIAGVAGALIGYSRGLIFPDSFSTFANISFLVFAYLGGITSISGALVAGALAPLGLGYFVLNNYLHLGTQYSLIAGIALIVTAITSPDGIAGATRENVHMLTQRFRQNAAHADDPVEPKPPVERVSADEDIVGPLRLDTTDMADLPFLRADRALLLRTGDLSVRYGGVQAVADVSLEVRAGEIVGLIGPNGAGKTSLMDALTGFTKASGTVELCGEKIDNLPPYRRARKGLARTWQSVELFDDLTVAQNVTVGMESRKARDFLLDFVHPNRSGHRQELEDVLALMSLENHGDANPSDLSLGRQKLAGVARAIAARPRALLLDEPAAGLDSSESLAFGERLRSVCADGTGILLIDHDMGLVLGVCDYVYVMVFGEIVAEGTPTEVRQMPAVIEAYLGSGDPAQESDLVEKSL